MFFRDINPVVFRGSIVFLDLDGTLVPDGEGMLAAPEAAALSSLAENAAAVFLVSNNGLSREPELVMRHGIEAIISPHKKPSAKILDGLSLSEAPRVVIGDKWITDGWFAQRIGATFFHVRHLKNGEESFQVSATYALDAIVGEGVVLCTALAHSTLSQYVRLARPKQWIKNLLVLAPIFFAGQFLDIPLLFDGALAVVAFSCIASAGYVLNDILDRAEDAKHEKKRMRPVASGALTPFAAGVFGIFLFVCACAVALLAPPIIPWLFVYVLFQSAYSLALRGVPVLELIVIPSFFMIRLLAGGAISGVPLSGWILLTTFFAALYVTAGKRYAESRRSGPRAVLAAYPVLFLESLPAIAAALVIVAYALYSVLGTQHHNLVFTNIFVVFGILWYLNGMYAGADEDPESRFWNDMTLLIVIALWGGVLFSVFYSAQLAAWFY